MENVYIFTILFFSLFVGFCGVAAFYLIKKIKSLEASVKFEQADNDKLTTRLESVLDITYKFVEANDEKGVIETFLSLAMGLTSVVGVSFVPLDEQSQPMASIQRGEFPFPVPNAWLEYLATPTVRQECSKCSLHNAVDENCNLLGGPFAQTLGLYCFPIRSGERELGLFNIYLSHKGPIIDDEKEFLQILLNTATLALERERSHQRESVTLDEINTIQEKNELRKSIENLLTNLQKSFKADLCLLVINSDDPKPFHNQILTGKILLSNNYSMESIVQLENSIRSNFQISNHNGEDDSIRQKESGMCVFGIPITFSSRNSDGLLVLVNKMHQVDEEFEKRLIHLVANQIDLIISASDKLGEIEYKSIMAERVRLSREIHDGLAQTLGFLKLQVAQMFTHLSKNNLSRLHQTIKICYEALTGAYQDARQAIDGLRISPYSLEGMTFGIWLTQIADDYEAQSLNVNFEIIDPLPDLAPEVHAQLIRIVQEALTNVRRHAHTNQVLISCLVSSGDFVLEIRDDGKGFMPQDAPNSLSYGIRGMRERADLIGADLQVISQPGKGTSVIIRLPQQSINKLEVY